MHKSKKKYIYIDLSCSTIFLLLFIHVAYVKRGAVMILNCGRSHWDIHYSFPEIVLTGAGRASPLVAGDLNVSI